MLEFPGPEVFEAVVDRIETGVYGVDGKQRVVYWNHGAEKITGLLTQEMLGRPCASNLGLETLEHNPAMCVHQCPMERATREPRHDVTVSMRHRAGHLSRVRLWTMAVRNAAGEIVGAVKVFTDRANAPEADVEKNGELLEELHGESRLPGRAAAEAFLQGQIDFCTRDDMPKLKEELQKSVRRAADFEKLKDHIEMTVTAEGLRIELMEGEAGTFFESGNPVPTAEGKAFLISLAGELGKLPNKVSIEGHTDAKPFAKVGNYGNWELSADRANAARRLMQDNGMTPGQVVQIRGYADQQLRKKDSPEDPSNRRITVIVQYTPKSGEDASAEGAKGSEPPKDAEAPKGGEAAKPAEH